ncbi:unnamed protein product, partial [Prorocentrum cordatum]
MPSWSRKATAGPGETGSDGTGTWVSDASASIIPFVREAERFHGSTLASLRGELQLGRGRPLDTELPVHCLRWTHDTINGQMVFGTGRAQDRSVYELLHQLLTGEVKPQNITPLTVVLDGDRLYSISNRRLTALKMFQAVHAHEVVRVNCSLYDAQDTEIRAKYREAKTTTKHFGDGVGVRLYRAQEAYHMGAPLFRSEREWCDAPGGDPAPPRAARSTARSTPDDASTPSSSQASTPPVRGDAAAEHVTPPPPAAATTALPPPPPPAAAPPPEPPKPRRCPPPPPKLATGGAPPGPSGPPGAKAPPPARLPGQCEDGPSAQPPAPCAMTPPPTYCVAKPPPPSAQARAPPAVDSQDVPCKDVPCKAPPPLGLSAQPPLVCAKPPPPSVDKPPPPSAPAEPAPATGPPSAPPAAEAPRALPPCSAHSDELPLAERRPPPPPPGAPARCAGPPCAATAPLLGAQAKPALHPPPPPPKPTSPAAPGLLLKAPLAAQPKPGPPSPSATSCPALGASSTADPSQAQTPSSSPSHAAVAEELNDIVMCQAVETVATMLEMEPTKRLYASQLMSRLYLTLPTAKDVLKKRGGLRGLCSESRGRLQQFGGASVGKPGTEEVALCTDFDATAPSGSSHEARPRPARAAPAAMQGNRLVDEDLEQLSDSDHSDAVSDVDEAAIGETKDAANDETEDEADEHDGQQKGACGGYEELVDLQKELQQQNQWPCISGLKGILACGVYTCVSGADFRGQRTRGELLVEQGPSAMRGCRVFIKGSHCRNRAYHFDRCWVRILLARIPSRSDCPTSKTSVWDAAAAERTVLFGKVVRAEEHGVPRQ